MAISVDVGAAGIEPGVESRRDRLTQPSAVLTVMARPVARKLRVASPARRPSGTVNFRRATGDHASARHAYEQRRADEVVRFFMMRAGAPCVVDCYAEYFHQFISDYALEDLFIFNPQKKNTHYGRSVQLSFFPDLRGRSQTAWHYPIDGHLDLRERRLFRLSGFPAPGGGPYPASAEPPSAADGP